MSLGHKFIGKNARPSRDSVLEFWSSKTSCSERENILCIYVFKKVVLQFVGNLETKKGGIFMSE